MIAKCLVRSYAVTHPPNLHLSPRSYPDWDQLPYALRADPGGRRAMERVSRAAGASQRTLERLFLQETAMTLGRWRRRLRLVEALRLLAAGEPVTRVALDVGYATPSAFIEAFRRSWAARPAATSRASPTNAPSRAAA